MPTEVILNGVECRLNQESDPEVFVCTWRGNEVVSGDGFILSTADSFDTAAEEALNVALAEADYELA